MAEGKEAVSVHSGPDGNWCRHPNLGRTGGRLKVINDGGGINASIGHKISLVALSPCQRRGWLQSAQTVEQIGKIRRGG
jgi:hypothetical protein